MAVFEFTSPDGQTYEVEGPDGATEAQAFQMLQRQMGQQRGSRLDQELSHGETEPGAALPAASPPQNLSDEGLSWGQAFQVGRTRGNQEEMIDTLGGGSMTEDPQGNLYWTPEGGGQAVAMNPPGFDWADIPRMAGEEIGQGLGGAAGAMLGKSPLGIIGKAALGGFTGSMANEGVQELEGTQRDPWLGKIAPRAGVDAVLEGGLAGAGMLASKMLPGGGIAEGSGSAKAMGELREAIEFAAANPDFNYPAPLAADILEVTGGMGLPAPMIKRLRSQSEAMTGSFADQGADRAVQAERMMEREFVMPPQAAGDVNADIVDMARGAKARADTGVEEYGPGYEAGSQALTDAAAAANRKVREDVSAHYEGPLKDAIREESPVFDLTPVSGGRKSAFSRTELQDSGLIDADGAPIMKEVLTKVEEEIPSPAGRIKYLRDFVGSLDPTQGPGTFDGIKRIRTEVGKMMEDPAFRTQAGSSARQFYGELTDVMENPVNAGDTPRYLKELAEGNRLQTERIRMEKEPSARSALKGQGGQDLLLSLANDPGGMATPEFRKLMDQAPQADKDIARQAAQQSILSGRDPAAAIDKLNDPGNRDSYDFLFSSRADRNAFERQADQASQFWKGPAGKIYDVRNDQYEATKMAVEQMGNSPQAKALWEQANPVQKESMRTALMDNTVQASMAQAKDGTGVISPNKLQARIKEMKKNRTWGMLTPEQQKRVTGLKSYYRMVLNSSKDLGTSLESASTAADLKNLISPTQFMSGVNAVMDIAHSRMVAKFLSSPKQAEKLMKRLNKVPRDKRKWATGAILAAPFTLVDEDLEYTRMIEALEEG